MHPQTHQLTGSGSCTLAGWQSRTKHNIGENINAYQGKVVTREGLHRGRKLLVEVHYVVKVDSQEVLALIGVVLELLSV